MPSQADIEQLRARLSQKLGALSAVREEMVADTALTAVEDAKHEEARAEAARSGKLGPAWLKVQQKVDLGQTTLSDVFSGRDDSPEAIALVASSRAKLVETSIQMDEAEDEDPLHASVSALQTRTATFEMRMSLLRQTTEGKL